MSACYVTESAAKLLHLTINENDEFIYIYICTYVCYNLISLFLAQWNTICLELPHSYFKLVASNIVFQLKRLDRQIPALSIASALSERLTDLLVGGRLLEAVNAGHSQRFLMHAEATRRQTFVRWPHMDYK